MSGSWEFDDLENEKGINRETHRQFFHNFIKYGRTLLYNKYIQYSIKEKENKTHTKECKVIGMPKACGSMDICYVIIEKYSRRLKQNHLGNILILTYHSFNLTFSYHSCILHTIAGHPALWNDTFFYLIILQHILEMET